MSIIRTKRFRFLMFFVLASSLIGTGKVSALSAGQEIELNFILQPTISITTSGSLTVSDLLPNEARAGSALTVSVTTNSAGGYVLGATVGDSSNTTSSLTNSSTSSSFSMLGQDVSPVALSSLANETWGISIDNGSTFMGLPLYTSSAKTLKTHSSAVESDTLTIKLGAKASSETETGTYSNVINFIATTQDPVLLFDGITTMQEMTPEICEAATINDSAQLLDSRDSKLYWITKLADGNCWMTQNLDLDITTADLTNADTDLNSVTAWNSSSTYAPKATETATSSSSTDTDTRSWDLGDYVYDGTTNSSCGASATSYANCTSYGFSSASGLAANSTARHYHVGNLYQWNTATAGSGGTITSGEAQDSICPKGWRLPTSTSSGEFQALVTAYSADSTVQTLLDSPLYFVRGSLVGSGTLRDAGYVGYYWSSTPASSSLYAYYLNFGGTSSVHPSDIYNRYYGFSVRCVARGIENISQITTMQQFGSLSADEKTAVMNSMTTGAQYQLPDSRDNKLYWVSKLADGNVWMTQNLDFVISTSGTTLTTSDSDVTSDKTLTAANGWGYDDITFYEGGDNYLLNGTGSATSATSLTSDSANWHYHVGNYYNWTAATAGSGTSSAIDADATESICPKGWRLPTSNSYTNNYSFGKLTNAYNITNSADGSSDANLLSSPLWFVRAGYVESGDLGDQGSTGNVWSSRAGSDSYNAYDLYFYSSSVCTSNYDRRRYGFSVRCVLR